MRILHALSQIELTGSEAYAQTLAIQQSQQGHSIFIASDHIHLKFPGVYFPLKLSESSWLNKTKLFFKIRKIIIQNKIDIVHCHSRGASRHFFWATLGTPAAIVTTLHGRQHFSWSKWLFDSYGQFIISICQNLKLSLIHEIKVSPRKIKLLPNPVDLKPVENRTEPAHPHLAIIGRASGPKGQRLAEVALKCLPACFDKIPQLQVSLILSGLKNLSPSQHQDLLALQSQYPDLKILDHVENLKSMYSQFTSVLGGGRIAIEAALLGKNVFVLGENTYLGLLTEDNLQECIDSNFADIGTGPREYPLPVDQIRSDLLQFLSVINPTEQKIKQAQRLSEYYSVHKVSQQILEIYKAAVFKKFVKNNIPVLMYHKVPTESLQTRHRIFVTQKTLEEHFEFFKFSGFKTLTFNELSKYWNLEKSYQDFPKKPLILTFDDGYKDNLINAAPLLKKYNHHAVIYLLANHSITENTWDADTGEAPSALMTLEEKKQLLQTNFEIGSHGYDHIHLTKVSVETALQQMKKSKESLEKDFNIHVTSFAYPYGDTNPQLAELAQQAGYQFAVNTDTGGLHISEAPLSIFRVNIFPEDNVLSLGKKTSWWYRNYFYWKRKR